MSAGGDQGSEKKLFLRAEGLCMGCTDFGSLTVFGRGCDPSNLLLLPLLYFLSIFYLTGRAALEAKKCGWR